MFPMIGRGLGPGIALNGLASSHPTGFSSLMGWLDRISATVA